MADSGTLAGSRTVNTRNTAIPQQIPMIVGMMSAAVAPERETIAAHPIIPPPVTAMLPSGTRRRSEIPAPAAIATITTTTATDTNSLSAVPNVWMAHSLTAPGVRSMTVDPTAFRASAAGPNGTAPS
jgi:N-dimethylarginine dimethylaminohydrolase